MGFLSYLANGGLPNGCAISGCVVIFLESWPISAEFQATIPGWLTKRYRPSESLWGAKYVDYHADYAP